jgi:hypothetical protein
MPLPVPRPVAQFRCPACAAKRAKRKRLLWARANRMKMRRLKESSRAAKKHKKHIDAG